MWQSHLPTALRVILTVKDSKSLDILASIADKLECTAVSAKVKSPETSSSRQQTLAGPSDKNLIMGELAKINLRLKYLERGRLEKRYQPRLRT